MKAADQGHANAKCCIGVLYRNVRGVDRDYSKGEGWFMKAASQEYSSGEYYLGELYELSWVFLRIRQWRWSGTKRQLMEDMPI